MERDFEIYGLGDVTLQSGAVLPDAKLAYKTHGVLNGRRILPFEWIRDIRDNGDREAWAKGSFVDYFPHARYRSRWCMMGDAHDAAFGIGIHGQTVYVDRAAGMVIAKLSTHARPLDDKLFDDMFCAFAAIGHHLTENG